MLVREREVAFTAYKDVLQQASSYFYAALNGSWAKSEDGKHRLPEESAIHFRLFLDWAYSDNLDVMQPGVSISLYRLADR